MLAVAALLSLSACDKSPTAPGGAVQTTYYVAPSGSDQNRGTLSAPMQTIKAAVQKLKPGDTLYIRGGIYTGPENVIDSQTATVPAGSSWSAPITITGYQGEAVVLRPPYNVSGIRLTTPAQSYLIFQDFTIDMTNSGAGSDADGIFVSRAHHVRFQRLEVMNSYNFGITIAVETPFNEVLDSRIHDNGIPGGPVTNGHGFYISGSDNLIQNNEVYGNQGYGFHIYNNRGSRADPSRNVVRRNRIHGNGRHGGTAYGLTIAWGDGNRVEENQIYDNPGGIQVYTDSTNTEIVNNTIYNNVPLEGIIVQYATGTQVRNNNVYANGSNIVDLGTATIVTQ